MFIYVHVPLAPIRRAHTNSHQSVNLLNLALNHLLRYFYGVDFLYHEKIHAKIIHITRWSVQIFCIFTPNLGEMIQFDVCIFFKGVGSNNHQLDQSSEGTWKSTHFSHSRRLTGLSIGKESKSGLMLSREGLWKGEGYGWWLRNPKAQEAFGCNI